MDFARTNRGTTLPPAASHRRRGSMIIEATVASVLLATGVVAVARLASASARLRTQAKLQLAAELESQNVLERLRDVPIDEFKAAADLIAKELKADGYGDVEISVTPVPIKKSNGDPAASAISHVFVRISVDSAAAISQDWRIESPSKPRDKAADSNDSESEDSETEKPNAKTAASGDANEELDNADFESPNSESKESPSSASESKEERP